MQGFYDAYPDNALIPHEFLPQWLQVRRASCKIQAVIDDLNDAFSVTRMPKAYHMSKTRSRVQVDLRSIARSCKLDSTTPVRFYVAGGYGVSEILGFTDFSDIDVWLAPQLSETQWVAARGKVCSPVSIMVVTDPVAIIESFDLHICSCALLCTVTASKQRIWDLYLTRLCAKA